MAESRTGRISSIDVATGAVFPIASGLSFPSDLAPIPARGCLKGYLSVEPTESAIPPLAARPS